MTRTWNATIAATAHAAAVGESRVGILVSRERWGRWQAQV
jgi:hypothetical protein